MRDESDSPPPDDFDYGERQDDGQYENYPTVDEGEFVQEVRYTYVHDVNAGGCGEITTMSDELAESVARDPTYYGRTFCCGCNDHVPVDEVVWMTDGKDWDFSGDGDGDSDAPALSLPLPHRGGCDSAPGFPTDGEGDDG